MYHSFSPSKGYYQPEALYSSLVYGGSQYVWNGRQVQDPILGDDGKGSLTPLLENVRTKELFFLRRIDDPNAIIRQYITAIQMPPWRLNILWPVDLVQFGGNPAAIPPCSVALEQHYHYDQPSADQTRQYQYGLLFPYGGYPHMESASSLLPRLGPLTWRNPNIRRLLCRLAAGFDALNQRGYFYLDIHFSRLFFLDNGQLYFNYSNLVFPDPRKQPLQSQGEYALPPGSYPVEFAEPALVQGKVTAATLDGQNYSLAALFFYLMFGRYPYDGRLMDGYSDQTLREHYEKFRDYHKLPVFIFDPEDTSNALGDFAHEQSIVESWKALPKGMQDLFVQILSRPNAERQTQVRNPGPAHWLQGFRYLGWDETVSPPKQEV